MPEDTICAPATPPINSPLAIIRISGPDSIGVVKSLFSKPDNLIHRTAVFGTAIIYDEPVDDVIVIYFKSPESFTGEDMAEITCHGNPIIVRKIIRFLNKNGVRLAEPGEFSKRSFLNGKIDLTEAEAINHIITARSDWEVSSAIQQMHGSLRDTVYGIREHVIYLRADIESGIDFIEEDIDFISYEEAIKQIDMIKFLISDLSMKCRIGEKISHGIDLPIIGRPNVGKSSILNLIVNQERAIVSDIPGTTRDLIDEVVQIAGLPINIIDTAGITTSNSEIEKIGIELSNKKITTASIILFVIDAGHGITDSDLEIFEKIRNKNYIILANKIDLILDRKLLNFKPFENVLYFSAKTAEGLAELKTIISETIRSGFINYEGSFITDMRILDILDKALGSAEACKSLIMLKEPREIIASELQSLADIISEITGQISSDDILDSIFSRFCIGK